MSDSLGTDPARAGARNRDNGIVVQKFGGSSLADTDMMNRAAGYVVASQTAGNPTVVVVSARGRTTDELLELAAQNGGTSHDLAREVDQLVATGEYVSAALMAMAVRRLGVPAISLTGVQAGIQCSGRHGVGVIAGIETGRIRRHLEEGTVVVVGGFQGANDNGDVVTLGRGGSDTTAVALAVALDAGLCEIYTDVDGIYTADPRLVPGALPLAAVDSHMMAEMAFSGAKVLHSRAVELLALQEMTLQVRNTMTGGVGTLVAPRVGQGKLEAANAVVAVTHDFDVARVLVQARRDLAADILAAFAANSIQVDLVARSGANEDEFRMGFTARRSQVTKIRDVLHDVLDVDTAELRVDEDVAKVSLIGMGLLSRPEYAARMMSALSSVDISTGWLWTSQLRVSAIVPTAQAQSAVAVLHQEFQLDQKELRQSA